MHDPHDKQAPESAEAEDELSPEIGLPKIDMSLGARFHRADPRMDWAAISKKRAGRRSFWAKPAKVIDECGKEDPRVLADIAKDFPQTLMNIADKSAGRRRGLASGKARAPKWKAYGLALAKQIRAEQPDITQVVLAEKMEERWESSDRCPRTRLIPAIGAWEDSGELPQRKKRNK
ncbi:hypothetical protein [Methylocystis sp.]|uniref:hypothetical protein n=1 Tax=Methylocystis sp. TaxID=1911079 RepID=UPI003D0D08DA